MATTKHLDDLTECPSCREVYTDPRLLPCVHTFCLTCIQGQSEDKQPGDELACPLCGKEFTVPSNGVGGLAKNFFVQKFLQMRELSGVESQVSHCEACSEGEVEEKRVATVYCVECQQKICQTCEQYHRTFKATRHHSIVNIGDELVADTLFDALPENCETHSDDPLKIYCVECESAMCTMCYMESHKTHECSDISKVDGDLRKRMAGDVEKTSAGVEKYRQMLQNLEKEESELEETIVKIEDEISEKAEQLKQMIDAQKERLVYELLSLKQQRMKEIESLREEIERQLVSLESYKKYVDKVREKGSACDIVRSASVLHDRAGELVTFDAFELKLVGLGHADVTFTSSNFVMDDFSESLGKLHLDINKAAVKSTVPTLTHVIPSQGRGIVCAVTSLDDEVFVSRYGSQQIEVYDASTFALQRHLSVPDLGAQQQGIAACPRNRCLYVSDDHNSGVHRVDLVDSMEPVKMWSVASRPVGLSVNREHNLVVACCEANVLQEYTTLGTFVNEIRLQVGVLTSPWHAVQLSTGVYVVSQNTSPGLVTVVGLGGQVVYSYGQSQTSGIGPMSGPSSLAVTANDDIFVADEHNDRVLSINRATSCVQVLDLSVDGGIQAPRGMCLDSSRGRLYIGEWGGEHRVLVFDGFYTV